ncbi:DUF4870 domain-containing protein [Halomicrobium sp. LC1Hm]|uniref:DUF4870 domain-containing protein n=1 Tax=Halomicrobium sp. LC1Hm TaxID=2610902 RepID=UPI0012983A4D|nr:DUF4870 domain-containing protein [Halomicrobium sp. LC1Hm]QGA83692.1 putative membrane protein [Halomicrobium sp. LC1Hm]
MTSNTSAPKDGPELLDERPVGGILVHPFALLTAGIGAGLVYLVANHEFTRTNARNVLNWHLSVLALTAIAVLTFTLGADELTIGSRVVDWSLLGPPLDTIVAIVGTLLLLLTGCVWSLTWVFTLIATVKAILGDPWNYPFAREFVNRESRTSREETV